MSLTFEEWAPIQPGGGSYAEYEAYVNASGGGSSVSGESGGAAGSKVLNLNSGTPYQRPAGIPAYNGYQAPDYAATTPNTTHWLNTMNAFAPTARTDMERLLGQGGGLLGSPTQPAPSTTQQPAPSDYSLTGVPLRSVGPNSNGTVGIDPTGQLRFDTDYYGSTGLLGSPTQPAPSTTQQPAPTTPFPTEWTRNSAPGYMDAFWNVPGSAYAPPGTPTKQQTAYSQPASTQQSSWSNGTVGINPATGSLTFL